MRYSPRAEDPVFASIEQVVKGLGMVLVELSVSAPSRGRRGQVRAVVGRPGAVGIDDCSLAHRAILPRLELAFPGEDLYVEVSSPGIDRQVRDAAEFPLWLGRGLRCYRTDTAEWVGGILRRADSGGLGLDTPDGPVDIDFELIAKARLDHSLE